MSVRVRFLKYCGICSFGKDDDFIGFGGVFDKYAHAFSGGEGEYINELIYNFLLL